jgi:phosphoserine phosphatase
MFLYVVRHGETQWNKEEVFRGRKDVPLNETGRVQAEKTGSYFADKAITRIVSSPLRRAVETAEGIGRATGLPVERMDDFIDMGFGTWEGLSLREVERLSPADLRVWRDSPQRLRVEGGERLGDVKNRLVQGLAKAGSRGEGDVVLVTHRVLCKLAALYVLRAPNSRFWGVKCDPASITIIERKGTDLSLVLLNDTCHLRTAAACGVS